MFWKAKHTIAACFVGYIVQAVVNNFVPLLFLMFRSSYGIPLQRITLLITFNFAVQLIVDVASIGFIKRVGYRAAAVTAHALAALGFALIAVLPEILDPFTGLLLGVAVYAVGGGLLEVVVSPIVEACPTENKQTAMSLLHSFYCWGHVGVVLLSTLFFACFGIGRWKILLCLWAILPIANGIVFTQVPIYPLLEEGERGMTIAELARSGSFWLFALLMACAGAAEQSVSQWASTFAEQGLGVSKTVGDLLGPMLFAACMGASRAWYGKFGAKIDLKRFMLLSCALCIVAYGVLVLCGVPIFGFLGCGLAGLSVGILWPGTFSLAAGRMERGGTALFALLALAGDVGCSAGPTLVGFVSGAFSDQLRAGLAAAMIFPLLMLLGMLALRRGARLSK